MSKRRSTFASLKVRNFRLFWIASLIANIGAWMSIIAQDWLVLTKLTDNSAAALGLVSGLQFLPIPFLTPLAGALADRFSKRRMLEITQAALMINSLVLALLVTFDVAQLWHVYVIAFTLGIVQAFDAPARQSFVAEMVGQDLLPNAVGLNSMQFNSARLVGPAVSGVMIGWFGLAPAIWINAISFLAPIGALFAMKGDELFTPPARKGKGSIREGFSYVAKRPDLLLIFLIVFTLGTFGLNFQVFNALMSTEAFGLGADAYGLLGSMMAVGTLTGAVIAARRGYPRFGVIVLALAGFALGSVFLAAAPSYWIYSITLVPVGFLSISVMTTANSRVQLTTDPQMRGRVMALYMAIFLGGTPLGAPLVGWVGEVYGARATLMVSAVTNAVVAVWAGVVLLMRSEHYPSPLHFLEVTRDRARKRRKRR